MFRFTLFIIIALCMFSCTRNSDNNANEKLDQNEVFADVIPQLLAKTVPDVSEKKIVILSNVEGDSVMYWALLEKDKMPIEAQENIGKIQSSLNEKLKINYKNSLRADFSLVHESSQVDSVFKYHSDNVIGFISLNNIIFEDSTGKGYFMYMNELGDHGGGVYLVSVKKDSNPNWQIDSVYTLLVSESSM